MWARSSASRPVALAEIAVHESSVGLTGLILVGVSGGVGGYLDDEVGIEGRAVEILALLADRGQHRAPSIPDLIIAATAELAGLTILHLNQDFDVIAAVTGQALERLNT
jgi:hypothetical protein